MKHCLGLVLVFVICVMPLVAYSNEGSVFYSQRTYLIIAPEKFKDAAIRLADYRGVDYKVVKEFISAGSDESVVSKMIKQNYTKSMYLVLIGRCEDMPCHVETETHELYDSNGKKSVQTYVFFSDTFFSDINKDGYPEISMGRIPVSSEDELNIMIDKVVSFEKKLDFSPKKYVFVGGSELSQDERIKSPNNAWHTGSFFDENIIPLLGFSSVIDKIYCYCHNRTNECLTNTERLVKSINTGADVVAFDGHGSETTMHTQCCSGEFTNDTIHNYLHNKESYPIFISLSCNNSNILYKGGKDGYQSIGEEFLTTKDAGAVAFIGASTTTGSKLIENMATALFGNLAGRYESLGDAFRDAKKPYVYKGKIHDNNFQLLGDPALRIHAK